MKCIEDGIVRWPEIWKLMRVCYIIALRLQAANDAQNVRVDTARGNSRIYQKR